MSKKKIKKINKIAEEKAFDYQRELGMIDSVSDYHIIARRMGFYDGFIAGAEWQKEQMMKDGNVILAEEDFDAEKEKSMEQGYNLCKEQMMQKAVKGEVHPDDCEIWVNLVGYGYKFNEGDKVSIIVLKAEEEQK